MATGVGSRVGSAGVNGPGVGGGVINGVGRGETMGNGAPEPISSSVGFGVGTGDWVGCQTRNWCLGW